MPFIGFRNFFFQIWTTLAGYQEVRGGGGGGLGLGIEQLRNSETFRMNNHAGLLLLKTFSSCRCIVGCLPFTLTNRLEKS